MKLKICTVDAQGARLAAQDGRGVDAASHTAAGLTGGELYIGFEAGTAGRRSGYTYEPRAKPWELRRGYPHTWRVVSRHASIAMAEKAADKIAGQAAISVAPGNSAVA